jgi:hypothetical protein
LRVVAEHADIWNFPNPAAPTEEFKRKTAILHSHCEAVGRDPAEIKISVQPRVDYENMEQTTKSVQRLVDAGATHVVLNLRPPYPDGIVQRLADEVISAVSG